MHSLHTKSSNGGVGDEHDDDDDWEQSELSVEGSEPSFAKQAGSGQAKSSKT